jgi:glycosyltransferase involved in cell wall biosynthesis
VTFLGQWPPQAVQAAWRRAAAGVLPSICREACPTVIIEAMRAGTPMIATQIGGIPDLVLNEQTGLLVAPGDAGALRAALARIASEQDLRLRLGEASRTHAASFLSSSVVPRVEALYAEVLGRRAEAG